MPRIPQLAASLLLTSLASAQSIVENLSFGTTGVISPSGHGIPNWHASSVNHEVQVLSDRVIITPPYPANAKGALWTEQRSTPAEWTAEVSFRASGQEYGSGNLNIWYTNDRDQVGVNSVYNVEKFDGMVLVIDQYGNTGGKIRGFLNDGTQNFRTHSAFESLAFGHCDYPYRNRGEYSRLRISNSNGLTVSIDDKTCFSTDKVSMPQGYYFGISGSTGENPDTFEVSKFVVTASAGSPVTNQANMGSMAQPPRDQPPRLQKLDSLPGAPQYVPDRDAEEIKSQSDQFADLHNRIQAMQHIIAEMFQEFKSLSDKIDSKQSEMLMSVQNMKGSQDSGLSPEIVVERISTMSEKISRMETTLDAVKKETSDRDYREHLHNLHEQMEKVHGGLTEGLPDRILDIISRHSPRIGFLIFVVVGVQICLAGAYVLYKRRRNSIPKKFL